MIGQLAQLPRWIVAAAVVTRLIPIVLAQSVHGRTAVLEGPDSAEYVELASSLAWHASFERGGFPEIARTPLFPLLVVPGTWLGAPFGITVLLQLAGALVVTALVFDTARRLTGGTRAATIAAAVYLLEPLQPIWTTTLLADGLLTCLVAAGVWLAVKYRPDAPEAQRRAAGLAIVAALAAYAKPPGYFFGVGLGVCLLASWWSHPGRRRLVSHVVLLLLLNVAVMSAWNVRNYIAAGYAGFSSQIERALFVGAPASLTAAEQGETWQVARARTQTSKRGGEHEAESVRRFRRDRGALLLERLPSYLAIHLKGSLISVLSPGVYWWNMLVGQPLEPTMIARDFLNAGTLQALRRARQTDPGLVVRTILFSLWPIVCLGLWGVALWRRRSTPGVGLVSGIVIWWVLLIGGGNADSRFRSPIVPALSVLAAVGLVSLRTPDPQPPLTAS